MESVGTWDIFADAFPSKLRNISSILSHFYSLNVSYLIFKHTEQNKSHLAKCDNSSFLQVRCHNLLTVHFDIQKSTKFCSTFLIT